MSRRLLQRGRYPKDNSMYQSQATNKQEPQAISSMSMMPTDAPLYNTQSTQQTELWQPQFQPVQQQNSQMMQQVPMQPISWSNDASYSSLGASENDSWNWSMQNNSHTPNPQLQTQFQPTSIPSLQTQYLNTTPVQSYSTSQYATEQPLSNQNFNIDYTQQNTWYTGTVEDSKKLNGNQTAVDSQSSQWGERVPTIISQPEQLSWTYSVPQNVPLQYGDNSYMQNLQMSTASIIQNWNDSNSAWPEPNVSQDREQQSHPYANNASTAISSSIQEPSQVSLVYQGKEDEFNNSENIKTSLPIVSEILKQEPKAENGSGSLSAFFHHSIEENKVLQDSSLSANNSIGEQQLANSNVENIAILQSVDHESALQCDNSIQNGSPIPNPNKMLNQSDCYLQNDGVSETKLDEPVHVVEDPPNQEVPEPNVHFQMITNKASLEENSDEPPNQQVPMQTNSMTPDRSTLTLEENSHMYSSTAEPEKKVGLQEVNLETLPDNLERPPDHDETRENMSLSATFRQHLRKEKETLLDSSKTSLWDEPHVPHVLLVPASPVQIIAPISVLPPIKSQKVDAPMPVQLATSAPVQSASSIPVEPAPSSLIHSSSGVSAIAPVVTQTASSIVQEASAVHIPTSTPAIQPVISTEEKSAKLLKPADSEVVSAATVLEKLHTNVPVTSSPSLQQNLSQRPTPSVSPIGPPSADSTSIDSKDLLVNPEVDKIETKSYNDRYPKSSSPLKESASASHLPSHQGHSRSFSDMRNRNYPPENDYPPHNYPDHYRSLERYPDSSRSRHYDSRYSSFEERSLYEKEGSRPSSRMSLDESMESQTSRDRKHYHSDYDRPPSRMSESEAYRSQRDRAYQYADSHYPSQYNREEEYYQRMRGYRGYEYDPYQQARHPYYGYYDQYRYNYNYGFYDELYRNDPRYRKQVEDHYREYYKQYGYDTQYERSSAYSGRSSTNELTKDTQRYTENDGTPSDLQYPPTYDEQSQFSSFEVSDGKQSTPAPRLTPSKFNSPHAFAHFSTSGQLITVTPTNCGAGQPPLVQIHDMQFLTQEHDDYKELKSFQGPLVRRETHKNDIIEFCLQKVKFYKEKEDIPDRESYVLLWELLILLLRQNGSVAGSDIAELLLKDHEVLRPLSLRNGLDHDNSPADTGDNHASQAVSGDASSPDEGIVVTRDKTILNNIQTFDLDKVTRKFREFLLFGHKKDALEWAMKHALWGHALFLASKMDVRTYANVMIRFANSLALNDPLQTLYQLMSGRQPAAVTCIADKQWGDWRPHLAMILSNPSANSEVDLKSITTLGDTLAFQGCLPATHFCYLMAQVEFGVFSCKSSKMVLLCADHHLPFELFATNEAIQCTEIYEYVQSLANPGFMLPHLQAYKYIYAKRLVDHGFVQEALHYCEVLTLNFLSNPALFPQVLISQVHELASKLKYNDPHYLQGRGELVDQQDPEWFKSLTTLVGQEQVFPEVENVHLPSTDYYSEPTLENYSQPEAYHEESIQEAQTPATEVPTPGYLYNQQNTYSNLWVSGNVLQQQAPLHDQEILTEQPMNTPQHDMYHSGFNSMQCNVNGNMSQEVVQENQSISTPEFQQPLSHTTSPSHKFDFYASEKPKTVRERERTNSTSSLGMQRDRRDSTLSSGSDYGSTVQSQSRRGIPESRKPEEKAEKARAQVGRSWLGGIFSKLLPKAPNQMILPDDKNPTIVWDSVNNRWINTDSNEDGDTSNQPLAPPKDIELTAKTPPEVPNTLSMPPVAAASTPMTNRFQRPKIKGMRQNYVDILNTNPNAKHDSAPDMMFPSLPFGNNSLPKVFIPTAPISGEQPVDFITSQQNYNATQGVNENTSEMPRAPPMFDPAEFDSRRSSMNSVRHSVGPAHRTYPT